MKTLMKGISLCLIFLSTACYLQAQDSNSYSYNSIDYMKVEPGNHGDYMALEKAWKKIHEHNIKMGKYRSWHMVEVVYPTGSNEEYNYVVRTNFKDEAQLAAYLGKNPMPENWTSLLTAKEIILINRTSEIRTWVKSEVWTTLDYIRNEEQKGQVTVFNFFSIPDGKMRSNHHKVEQDIWKPIHQARMADNQMVGWVMATKRLPYGSNESYVDATVDIYTDMNQFITSESGSYFKTVHPKKSLDDIYLMTRNASDLKRSEVRQWVMSALPAEK